MTREQHPQNERRQRKRTLDDAGRQQDQILATLAHELSSPLAAVVYSTEILRRCDIKPEVREGVATGILEQIDVMRRLVEDRSELQGVRRGDNAVRRMLTDVAKVAHLAVEVSRPLIEERGHALDIAIPDAPIHAEGDDARLVQILTNLLSNAARYTPDGGRIRLSIGQEDGAVVLKVKDNGIGIPNEMLTRVFDLFTRLEGAKEKYADGMGIGLAFVRQLVNDQGGSVEAFSNGHGQGSEFVVRLPLAEDTRLRQPDVAAVQQGRNRTPSEKDLGDMPFSWAWG
jgi:signal transduction histidine kinase